MKKRFYLLLASLFLLGGCLPSQQISNPQNEPSEIKSYFKQTAADVLYATVEYKDNKLQHVKFYSTSPIDSEDANLSREELKEKYEEMLLGQSNVKELDDLDGFEISLEITQDKEAKLIVDIDPDKLDEEETEEVSYFQEEDLFLNTLDSTADEYMNFLEEDGFKENKEASNI